MPGSPDSVLLANNDVLKASWPRTSTSLNPGKRFKFDPLTMMVEGFQGVSLRLYPDSLGKKKAPPHEEEELVILAALRRYGLWIDESKRSHRENASFRQRNGD